MSCGTNIPTTYLLGINPTQCVSALTDALFFVNMVWHICMLQMEIACRLECSSECIELEIIVS